MKDVGGGGIEVRGGWKNWEKVGGGGIRWEEVEGGGRRWRGC